MVLVCVVCGKSFEFESVPCFRFKRRYFHKECLEGRIKMQEKKFPEKTREEDMRAFIGELKEGMCFFPAVDRTPKRPTSIPTPQIPDTEFTRKGVLKRPLTDEESKDRLELIDYIDTIFRKKQNDRVYMQIEDYFFRLGYGFKEMRAALYYFYEVRNGDLSKSNGGIGIVPYIFDEAMDFYREEGKKRKGLAESIRQLQELEHPEVVTIASDTEKKGNARQIDLDSI